MRPTTFQPVSEPGCSLRITDPVVTDTFGGAYTYTFSIWLDRPRKSPFFLHTITYTSTEPIRCTSGIGNAAFISALFPAMALGVPLHIDAPVSPRLLQNAQRLQEIFSSWWRTYRVIEVHAVPSAQEPPLKKRGTGMYFSAGVDGFYTLKAHANEVSALIFDHGFDVDLDRLGHRSAIETLIENISDDFNRPLIVMESNIRSFSDPYIFWGEYSGAMLGAGACLLEGVLDKVLIASSSTISTFVPFGTNPLTDPLYSTEHLRSIHADQTISRTDKLRELTKWDYAMKHLRVCWGMEGSATNCCVCGKCLRTMTSLWLDGSLDKAPTFELPLIPEAIAQLPSLKAGHRIFAVEHIQLAETLGLADHPVTRAWRDAVLRSLSPGGADTLDELEEAVRSDPLKQVWANLHRPALLHDLAAYAPKALYREVAKRIPEGLDQALAQRDPADVKRNTVRLFKGYATFAIKRITRT